MYAAYSSKGELIYANDLKNICRQSVYYCPDCQQVLSHKISRKGKGYFSHVTSCQSDTIQRETKESLEHQTGKSLLKYNLELSGYEAHTEYNLPQIQQIADVFYYGKTQQSVANVLEFQRVPVNSSQIETRHTNYLQLVKHCQWIIDDKVFKTGYQQVWLKTMLNYSKELGFHWWALDIKQAELVLKFRMPLMYEVYNVKVAEQRFDLNKTLDNYWDFSQASFLNDVYYSTYRLPIKQRTYFRQLKSIMVNSIYQNDIRLLYAEGVLLQMLPAWMLMEKWHFLVCKTPGWLCLAWFYWLLSQFELKQFTTKDFAKGIQQLVESEKIVLASSPLISVDIYPHLSDAVLTKFKEKKLIFKVNNMQWRVLTQQNSF